MKKISLFLLVLLIFTGKLSAGNPDIPVSHLRAPAYPLITIDPYISAWSHTDKLYDDDVRHWTGEKHPLLGALRVDGKVYRFMGKGEESLIPFLNDARYEKWQAKYTTDIPSAQWYERDYDDKHWHNGTGAFGTPDMANIGTEWANEDIWIRRSFDITDESLIKKKLYLIYSHDDVFELFLNGRMIVSTGLSWNNYMILPLEADVIKSLEKQENVLAAHCHNTTGGSYVDFGLFTENELNNLFSFEAEQLSASVLPVQTYYSFYCGPVQLDVKFTSPLVLDNLDLLASPVNYISYNVRSLDNKKHDVQVYFSATPQWAVNTIDQEVELEKYSSQGISYLKAGSKEQNVLGKSGDILRIDWGYFFLAGRETERVSTAIGQEYEMQLAFSRNGALPGSNIDKVSARMDKEMLVMAYTRDLGFVDKENVCGYLMIGYDDIASIQYFGENLEPYWKSKYPDIGTAFVRAEKDYDKTMKLCDRWDLKVMEDARIAGGQQYAELCALSYRQAVAAHKLVIGPKGELFFLSKENNSNGSIGTVDVTYPSSPLFLRYNTEVAKGMLEFIFDYSESGRWVKPFPAHDIGTYPLANGQTYQEDMPVEEAGNMLIMTTAIAIIENNASYAEKHWKTLTVWVDYLMGKGLDPENQLCTEDFAGHLAHNTNLSAKAIMAIVGYGRLAEMLHKPEAERYIKAAKEMAVEWERMADDGDHYRLAFDKPGTWSQKYNFVWDKVLGLNIIPEQIMKKEIAFYLKQQREYGLPLDNRFTWTRVEEIIWSGTMASSMTDFYDFVEPLWKYANETPSRVPMGDWYETLNSHYINFRARSVVGGVFVKSLENYLHTNKRK